MKRTNKLAIEIVQVAEKYVNEVFDDLDSRDELMWKLFTRQHLTILDDMIYAAEIAIEIAPPGTTDHEIAFALSHLVADSLPELIDFVKETRIRTSTKQTPDMK